MAAVHVAAHAEARGAAGAAGRRCGRAKPWLQTGPALQQAQGQQGGLPGCDPSCQPSLCSAAERAVRNRVYFGIHGSTASVAAGAPPAAAGAAAKQGC